MGRGRAGLRIRADLWDLLPAATREMHYEALSHAMLHREPVNRELFLEEKHVWLELRVYHFAESRLVTVGTKEVLPSG